EPDHRRQRGHEDRRELRPGVKLSRLGQKVSDSARARECPREQYERHQEHEGRGPVLDLSEKVHAAVDDIDVERPEEKERKPKGRRVAADWAAQECGPTRNERAEESVQGLAAYPGLYAEPAARDNRAHQGREVRAVSSV